MAIKFITLKKSGTVPTADDLRDEYIPAVGEICELTLFIGHAAFSTDAAVCVCWDEGGASEQVIWSTKGDSSEDRLDEVIPAGDGVKKIELILDNSTASPLVLTGKAQIKVKYTP
jgi:hypothetical protein